MLFMYIHTHTAEKCLVRNPQESLKLFSELRENFIQRGIKVIGSYVATHEHTMFFTLEADDYAALSSALIPLTEMGVARMIPIAPILQFTGMQ